LLFRVIGFLNGVTDKKSSWPLIYSNKEHGIYTQMKGLMKTTWNNETFNLGWLRMWLEKRWEIQMRNFRSNTKALSNLFHYTCPFTLNLVPCFTLVWVTLLKAFPGWDLLVYFHLFYLPSLLSYSDSPCTLHLKS
jgi:hypothetical protein